MMKKKTIYALGYFDGVHLGHQALLNAGVNLAKENGCASGAVTFSVHPQQLLTGKTTGLINTNDDREEMLLQTVDSVLELIFTEELKNMPWQDFCGMLVKAHGAAGFVCGSDFRFGKGGEGTASILADYCQKAGLTCEVVPQQKLNGIRISSTHIRTLLEQGKMEEAARFLGHPHVLTGTVVHGKQLGRTIGIPTANLAYPEGLVKLPFGVYACKAVVDGQKYIAMTNIGTRPTVAGEGVTVESHLLDFDGDLYGKHLELYFYSFLRPEYQFPDLFCLGKQVEKDKISVEKVMQQVD